MSGLLVESSLTHDRLLQALSYDPLTGVITSKSRGRRGMLAGCVNGVGYRVIRIDKKLYLAHRLAWFYIHGQWPKNIIDHIDGNRINNRFDNLRDIQKAQNHQNLKGPQNNSTTGFLGVTYSERRKHFVAQISINGRGNYIGSFSTADAAHEAYLIAKRKLHPAGTL